MTVPPKKLEVFTSQFCERCGLPEKVALFDTGTGWIWLCLFCQLYWEASLFCGKLKAMVRNPGHVV